MSEGEVKTIKKDNEPCFECYTPNFIWTAKGYSRERIEEELKQMGISHKTIIREK